MADTETLKVFERDNTVTSSKLRTIGYIPGTIYGKGVEPVSFQVKAHEFELTLKRGITQFKIEGLDKPYTVKVQQLQRMSTQDKILHIEFMVLSAVAA